MALFRGIFCSKGTEKISKIIFSQFLSLDMLIFGLFGAKKLISRLFQSCFAVVEKLFGHCLWTYKASFQQYFQLQSSRNKLKKQDFLPNFGPWHCQSILIINRVFQKYFRYCVLTLKVYFRYLFNILNFKSISFIINVTPCTILLLWGPA